MSRVVFYSEPNDRVRLAEDLAPDDLGVSVIEPKLPWDERKELLADTEVLILGGLAMPYEELIQLPKLKMLQLMSAGYDQIDVSAVREQGIFVSNNSPQIARSVAEHALGLMLTVQHQFVPGLEGVRDGSWRNPVRSGVYEIGGKTIGIIGLGNIGRLVATMVRGFGPAEVIYHDTAKIPTETAITIPTPPRGKRIARGAPIRTNTMHAKAMACFLWISTRNRSMLDWSAKSWL